MGKIQQRRKDLEGQLEFARAAASRAAQKSEDLATDMDVKDRGRRTQERRATEELANAQNDNVMLTENRLEWKRTRPQLELLIEELRVGSVESKHTATTLFERLAGLRKAVEAQKPGVGSSVAGSPMLSPPCASPERGATVSGRAGSDGESPIPKALDSALDSLGFSNAMRMDPPSPELPDGARDSEDPLIRKAAEESDLLHKRVLALEDERSNLIRGQEELIQFIRDKVEPVQRALNADSEWPM